MDPEELRVTAELAMLELTHDEMDRFRVEVETLLTYFRVLEEVNPVETATEDSRDALDLRPDIARSADSPRELVEAAEEYEDEFVLVPNIL